LIKILKSFIQSFLSVYCGLKFNPSADRDQYFREEDMQTYTIYPLVVGINETDQGVMTYLRDYGRRIYLPIYIFYLKGGYSHSAA
jgi:hypothetical protein